MGGLAFGDDFRTPLGKESDNRGLASGTESDEGEVEKLSAEAKNAPSTKLEQILVF